MCECHDMMRAFKLEYLQQFELFLKIAKDKDNVGDVNRAFFPTAHPPNEMKRYAVVEENHKILALRTCVIK